jgi:hypothetical protein
MEEDAEGGQSRDIQVGYESYLKKQKISKMQK